MARPSLRENIIQAGLVTLHERGFHAPGVREIMAAAHAPQSSFSNYFQSKEAFGLEVLNRYFERLEAIAQTTLCDQRRAPLDRLHAYFDDITALVEGAGWRHGCLISNMSLETAEHSDALRERLAEILAALTRFFADTVRAAQHSGHVRDDLEADDVATILLAAWHGALLRMKVDRSPKPLEQFRRVAFKALLPLVAVGRPGKRDS